RLLVKKDLLSLISENIDDYSLILITMIYLKKKNCSMNDLIASIDRLLTQTHEYYPAGNIRMAERFWLFRYFFYYLQVRGIIAKKDINSYYKKMKYKSGKKGYETELNWKYIRNNPKQNNIDGFLMNCWKMKYGWCIVEKMMISHIYQRNNMSCGFMIIWRKIYRSQTA